MIIALAFAFILSLVSCQPDNPDKITNLPLLNFNLTQYSGYIEVNSSSGRNLHYWFIESQGNPSTDPVVLWLNGGPGCSSLDGLFYEHGPMHFAQTPDITLVKNPYAWTLLANVIYLEAPAGVGFSYSNNPKDYYTNDNRTADDNYNFLQKFFAKYPQFAHNDFWITGESYAGVYVPTLAKRVLEGVQNGKFPLKFKGVMVGNGVTNSKSVNGLNAYVSFLYGHGFMSTQMFNTIHKYCDPAPNSPECATVKSKAYDNVNDIDYYNIYGLCAHQRPSYHNEHPQPQGDIPCVSSLHEDTYLNMPAVKQAIHVRSDITWSVCSDLIGNNYNQTSDSMVPIYKELLAGGVRVNIYSGDVDFSVPYTNTEIWTSEDMNLPVKRDWKQWFYTNEADGVQVGGFVTDYEGGFTYATVRGAGHMVPQFRPQAAYILFERFLKGEPL